MINLAASSPARGTPERLEPTNSRAGNLPGAVVKVGVPRGPGAVEGKGQLLVVLVLLTPHPEGGEHFACRRTSTTVSLPPSHTTAHAAGLAAMHHKRARQGRSAGLGERTASPPKRPSPLAARWVCWRCPRSARRCPAGQRPRVRALAPSRRDLSAPKPTPPHAPPPSAPARSRRARSLPRAPHAPRAEGRVAWASYCIGESPLEVLCF